MHWRFALTAKNEFMICHRSSMPNHGVEIIDGIPVHLKDGTMFAFQPGNTLTHQIKLGTYDSSTKKASWIPLDSMSSWLEEFRSSLSGRSRK